VGVEHPLLHKKLSPFAVKSVFLIMYLSKQVLRVKLLHKMLLYRENGSLYYCFQKGGSYFNIIIHHMHHTFIYILLFYEYIIFY